MERHALCRDVCRYLNGYPCGQYFSFDQLRSDHEVRSWSNTSYFKLFCSGIHRGCRAINVRSETMIIVSKNDLYLVWISLYRSQHTPTQRSCMNALQSKIYLLNVTAFRHRDSGCGIQLKHAGIIERHINILDFRDERARLHRMGKR